MSASLLAIALLGSVELPNRMMLTRRAAIGASALITGRELFVPSRSWALGPPLPLCDEDVSVLMTSSNKQIVLVGTAHVSEESATLVRQVIRFVNPDTVMVELDKPRASALLRKARARKNGETIVRAQPQTRGAAMYQSLDDMGFPAGGEFVAAIEEARALNATVLLGDRDINVTLQRLREARAEVRQLRAEGILSREDAVAAASALPSTLSQRGASLTAESVVELTTELKQRGNARAIAAYLQKSAPPVYAAMIGERDLYMAHALRDAPGGSVVGVVGVAHLEGIERTLADELSARPRSCRLPLRPRSSRTAGSSRAS